MRPAAGSGAGDHPAGVGGAPVERDARIAAFNPLAKVPALRTEQGLCLYDSRVICEYLNHRAAGVAAGRRRGALCLTRRALGDGLLDAALLAR